MAELLFEIADRIRATGPMRFDHYVEAALYDTDHGFFARGSGAGRAGGDFLTSPEVGPLFGALFARQLDRLWEEAGRPEQFNVVEVAAGRGALAIAVRVASPACAAALAYHMVERSESLRHRQAEHLVISGPDSGTDPRFYSYADIEDLPDGLDGKVDVVFANELLDNIPFRVLERAASGWSELHVDVQAHGVEADGAAASRVAESPPRLIEVLLPLSSEDSKTGAWAESMVPDASIGQRIPVQSGAAEWLAKSLGLVRVPGGAVITIDYCRPTNELAQINWTEWVRTYREHGRGSSPLDDPGSQDITCDVAPDQLPVRTPPGFDVSQAEWLAGLGIEELVDEGRRIWEENSAAPDLAAIRAR
ncbi:MAG TPA: SAM-dependent methyltransferase, partial [Microthrixaceae bacterium]|nr:SAM-dependent methyltransferase [Microthrixaceae bacterium]